MSIKTHLKKAAKQQIRQNKPIDLTEENNVNVSDLTEIETFSLPKKDKTKFSTPPVAKIENIDLLDASKGQLLTYNFKSKYDSKHKFFIFLGFIDSYGIKYLNNAKRRLESVDRILVYDIINSQKIELNSNSVKVIKS
jgi:hypothetical protein